MKEYCRVCGTNEAAEGKLVRIPDEYSFDGYKYVPACEDCYGMVGPNYRKSTDGEKPKNATKTKIFYAYEHFTLEDLVNDFIKDKHVVNIQHSPIEEFGRICHYAMIIYQEEE